jgi:ketosteroid isomerase-like protein
VNQSIYASLILALAATAAGAAEPPAAPEAAVTAGMNPAECAVWAREASFAASVAAHDSAAFRTHLHAEAVFIGGRGELTRGAAAITTAWQSIIDGEKIMLGWHPEVVTIAGDPRIALSRGPYWMQLPQPDGESKYLIGQFISTWVQGADGEWQVLFDGGGGNQPQPASAAEVAALQASLPESCPGQ